MTLANCAHYDQITMNYRTTQLLFDWKMKTDEKETKSNSYTYNQPLVQER